jgi:hypothetical protein
MSLFSNLVKRYQRLTPKQFIAAGVFSLVFAGTIGLGFASNASTNAAIVRDCDSNSIDRVSMNGGCGAADPAELVADARANNPGDLQNIYSHFGLTPAEYANFAANAKQGTFYRDGRIVVDGQTVMTDGWSMGREKFNAQRQPLTINGTTYYHSHPTNSFSANLQSLPVMVLFNADGSVKVAIMNPCGNPVTNGKKVTPKAACESVVSTQPDKVKKPNTYRFTAKANFSNNAEFSRAVYTITEGNTVVATVTKTSLTDAVEHTFKKDGKVTVTVFAKVPGGKEVQATHVVDCEKQIKYIPPFYVCVSLLAAPIDQQKRSFRFTVQVDHDENTSLKDVDFTLDSKSTTTGVTTKDKDDNIYKEYSFTDEVEHTVSVKVNFTTADGVQSQTCQAKVTPSKLPKCEVPGFEHLPPNDERCGYCKPGIPKGDDRCKEVVLAASTEMPKTGTGSTIGLFAGTVIIGAFAHRLFSKRRASKSAVL